MEIAIKQRQGAPEAPAQEQVPARDPDVDPLQDTPEQAAAAPTRSANAKDLLDDTEQFRDPGATGVLRPLLAQYHWAHERVDLRLPNGDKVQDTAAHVVTALNDRKTTLNKLLECVNG
jgi:hypothetical protein